MVEGIFKRNSQANPTRGEIYKKFQGNNGQRASRYTHLWCRIRKKRREFFGFFTHQCDDVSLKTVHFFGGEHLMSSLINLCPKNL